MATSGELTDIMAKALGVPFETVREHLRNIRRKPNTITFSGYGRSAAAMQPRDAVRLMLAVAGSQLVKDSRATLDAFAKLQPLRHSRRSQPDPTDTPRFNLEQHLAWMMQRVIDRRSDLPADYIRKSKEVTAPLALTLISAASTGSQELPRVAIARNWLGGGRGTISFATLGWTEPVLGSAEYAATVRDSGLIQERHVTTWAIAEIALAL
ncbi:MAG: hypothetical protein GC182_05490 [Rhodopseudomonas sp.]|nr:hypothetical protein [Rhodopseudomonas sp.]